MPSIYSANTCLAKDLVLGKHGQDKVGHTFLEEACRIGRALGFFSSEPASTSQCPTHVSPAKWQTVRAVTAWALFNFQIAMSFIYSFPVILSRPPSMAIPYCEDPNATGIAHGYGHRVNPSLTFHQALFQSECAKHVILLDCVDTLVESIHSDKETWPKVDEIETCYARLTHWWNGRSKDLDPDLMPTRENLLCAMMYHVNIINLHQAILHDDTATRQPKPRHEDARSVKLAALGEIHRLLALQQARHGWVDAILLVLHPITIASFGTLEEISRADISPKSISLDNSGLYQGLQTCLRALASLASSSYYAQPLFRLLTEKCQALGVRLPGDVQATLDSYMTEEWTRKAASLVSSQYIADTHATTADAASARMDAIISGWEALSLDGVAPQKDSRTRGDDDDGDDDDDD